MMKKIIFNQTIKDLNPSMVSAFLLVEQKEFDTEEEAELFITMTYGSATLATVKIKDATYCALCGKEITSFGPEDACGEGDEWTHLSCAVNQ